MAFEIAKPPPERGSLAGGSGIRMFTQMCKTGNRTLTISFNNAAQEAHFGRLVDLENDEAQIAYDLPNGLVRVQLNKGAKNARIRSFPRGSIGFVCLPWPTAPEKAKSQPCRVHTSPDGETMVIFKVPDSWRRPIGGLK